MRDVEIKIKVALDDKNIPQEIEWSSDDPPSNGEVTTAKAFFLSVFDQQRLETLRIDLWDQKFEIGEINRMMYYTFKGLADTYFRATNSSELSNDIARFAQYFGEESGVVAKTGPNPENKI